MMKREQAIHLEKCLADADRALRRASLVIASLAKEDRIRFGGLLDRVVDTLHSEMLTAIYDQHPDMEPPPADNEIPEVTSELRWEQVRLPPPATEADVDAIIFSVLKPNWQKVAMVVILADERSKEVNLQITVEALAARLQVLSESDRIEGVGDLRKWRHSEVRLKD